MSKLRSELFNCYWFVSACINYERILIRYTYRALWWNIQIDRLHFPENGYGTLAIITFGKIETFESVGNLECRPLVAVLICKCIVHYVNMFFLKWYRLFEKSIGRDGFFLHFRHWRFRKRAENEIRRAKNVYAVGKNKIERMQKSQLHRRSNSKNVIRFNRRLIEYARVENVSSFFLLEFENNTTIVSTFLYTFIIYVFRSTVLVFQHLKDS